MEKWLDMAAALLAVAAAVFWFLSAYGKLPPMVEMSISVGMGPQIGIQKGPLCFAF
jgi:hypothetical protein